VSGGDGRTWSLLREKLKHLVTSRWRTSLSTNSTSTYFYYCTTRRQQPQTNIMILTPLLAFQKILRTGPQRIHSLVWSRRTLLTQAVEPCPSSGIPERPCTVILAEHTDMYGGNSWHSVFQRRFPADFGVTYRHWSADPARTLTVDDALNQLMQDLSGIPDAVLVARGPWMSWLSQFFLESLPVKGLVMVDPMPLDDKRGIELFQALYREANLTESLEYRLFQDFLMHWDHWTLKLEPGSVPMIVLVSQSGTELRSFAEGTARRHSVVDCGVESTVPVVDLVTHNQVYDGRADEAVVAVSDWIEYRVL
jgi:hypothetical protein